MRRAITTSRLAVRSGRLSRVAVATPLPRAAVGVVGHVPALTSALGVRAHSTTPIVQPIPPISAENTYDIVIIGGGPAGLALAAGMGTSPS